MSASHNDVTFDRLVSKQNSEQYRDNWDKIFGKKDEDKDDEKDDDKSE